MDAPGSATSDVAGPGAHCRGVGRADSRAESGAGTLAWSVGFEQFKTLSVQLRSIRIAQAAERLRAQNPWSSTNYVFTTPEGGPCDPDKHAAGGQKVAAKKAGLPSAELPSGELPAVGPAD